MDTIQAATNQFQAAYNKAQFSAFIDTLRRRSTSMPSLAETYGDLNRYQRVSRGLKTIPVEQIVGSEGRAQSFDRCFQPRESHLKDRWSRVAQAMSQGVRLPPIQVYKLGEQYYVCDGNHRVSVARHRGQEQIEATVIELLANNPSMA